MGSDQNSAKAFDSYLATGCPFLIKIMRRAITIDKKIMR